MCRSVRTDGGLLNRGKENRHSNSVARRRTPYWRGGRMKSIPGTPTGTGGPDSSLGHVPEGRWAFDDGVTQVFDDMLRRSIPQYDVMRQAVFDVGCKFVKNETDIVDLGCARGEALAPFVDRYGAHNRYLGIEV